MNKPFGVTIETESLKGTPEFEKEIFEKMKNMMKFITKDLYKNSIIEFHKRHSNGSSWVVFRKEICNPRGMYTKHILGYYPTQEKAEFARQRYELKYKAQLQSSEDKQ